MQLNVAEWVSTFDSYCRVRTACDAVLMCDRPCTQAAESDLTDHTLDSLGTMGSTDAPVHLRHIDTLQEMELNILRSFSSSIASKLSDTLKLSMLDAMIKVRDKVVAWNKGWVGELSRLISKDQVPPSSVREPLCMSSAFGGAPCLQLSEADETERDTYLAARKTIVQVCEWRVLLSQFCKCMMRLVRNGAAFQATG